VDSEQVLPRQVADEALRSLSLDRSSKEIAPVRFGERAAVKWGRLRHVRRYRAIDRAVLSICRSSRPHASYLLEVDDVMCQMTCEQLQDPIDGEQTVVGMQERRRALGRR
jgi:hypothetical protein